MEHRRKDKSEYVVQAVDRALDVLEAFNYQQEELGVTELSNKLKLHKNKVFRLLASLETRGYIEQDQKTGNYRLGLKTFEVANVFLHHLGLRRQARPVLEELVSKCNETAYLAVTDAVDVVYVLMHETTHTVRVMPRLGFRLPAYCTASGKVQLAHESQDRLQQLIAQGPLRKLTGNTITDLDRLREHLVQVAQQGFAVDNEELEEGVRCVAAPVRDYSHRVVAGVGLSGPVSRFGLDRIRDEFIPLVKEAGVKISQRLGYEAAPEDSN
jgi:IclR family transcriptional regulator, KDG regulon repressor